VKTRRSLGGNPRVRQEIQGDCGTCREELDRHVAEHHCRCSLTIPMDCPECARLLAEYERLESLKTDAIHALYAGPLPAGEFAARKIAADQARLDAEVARLGLEQHQQNHVKANI
jgi:hypothetical protein